MLNSLRCLHNASLKLALARMLYFCTRRLWFTVTTRSGYRITTPEALISYWDICVERNLDGEWVDNLSMQQCPIVLDIGASFGAFTERVLQINSTAVVIAVDPQSSLAHCRAQYRYQMAVGESNGLVSLVGTGTNAHLGASSLFVQQIRLDDIPMNRPPYLIKIDVEGGQECVLAGGMSMLKLARYVIIEGHVSPHRTHAFTKKQLTEVDWLYTADII